MNYPPPSELGPAFFLIQDPRGGSWSGRLALSQVQGPRGGCWTQGGGRGSSLAFSLAFLRGSPSVLHAFHLCCPSQASRNTCYHMHITHCGSASHGRGKASWPSVPSRQPAAPPGDALQRQAETRAVMTRTVSSGRSRRARAGRRRSGGAWAARLRQRQRQRRQHQRQRQEKRHRGRPSHRVMMVPLRGRHHR